jgi:hypothetical protein
MGPRGAIMKDTELDRSTLVDAVAGDVRAFDALQRRTHTELRECNAALENLMLTSGAVRRVLYGVLSGDITPGVAQGWASFVRRGYIAGQSRSPILPIDITYEPETEDAIVEILARLDEVGDVVDGEVTDDEIRQMIASIPA